MTAPTQQEVTRAGLTALARAQISDANWELAVTRPDLHKVHKYLTEGLALLNQAIEDASKDVGGGNREDH